VSPRPAPDPPLLQALAALDRALTGLGVPFMIIGGIAVIARGVPRQTIDIDATVLGRAVSLDDLFGALGAHGIVPRIADAERFARRQQVLLLEHRPTGTTLEVSLAWLPFEEEALERSSPVDFRGIEVPVAQAQDLIVYKAVAWRDRDKADIERLLLLHGHELDLAFIRDLVRQFAEALEEPARVTEFEELVRRSLGGRG
jgi:predicted nucleotidyltransferase